MKTTTDWKPFEKFGCYARLENGTMLVAPMLENGERETDEGMVGSVEWEMMVGTDRENFDNLGCALLAAEGIDAEGEQGDALEVTCSTCKVRLGDHCQCESGR